MMESAPNLLKKIEDLAEMEARVETGHASLTDDLNNKTGASALRTIQDLGGSSTLSSGGAFSGSEKVASLTDVIDLVNNSDVQPVIEKKKRCQIEVKREEIAQKVLESARKMKSAVEAAMSLAREAEDVARDCEENVARDGPMAPNFANAK